MSALCSRIENFAAILSVADFIISLAPSVPRQRRNLAVDRGHREIAVADKPDAEFGNTAFDSGAQQS